MELRTSFLAFAATLCDKMDGDRPTLGYDEKVLIVLRRIGMQAHISHEEPFDTCLIGFKACWPWLLARSQACLAFKHTTPLQLVNSAVYAHEQAWPSVLLAEYVVDSPHNTHGASCTPTLQSSGARKPE